MATALVYASGLSDFTSYMAAGITKGAIVALAALGFLLTYKATGVVNFINFSFSALLGPVFGALLTRVSGGGERGLEHYQVTFEPLIYGVGVLVTGMPYRHPSVLANMAATLDIISGGRLQRGWRHLPRCMP